jgi:hypothetical protein
MLRLRRDGYLENMRSFLRRVWNESANDDHYAKSNAEDLAAQLLGEVNTAEREWENIDQNLATWFSSEVILGAGLGVLAGSVGWIPASTVAIAGSINLAISMTKRRKFLKYYPAGFLVKTIRQHVSS